MLAVLLIVAGLTLGLAREAIAYTFSCNTSSCGWGFPRDSDGYVPESGGDLNAVYDNWIVLGRTSWYSGATGPYTAPLYSDYTKYDWPATNYCNVPQYKVRAHEHAHSRGWGHGAGTSSQNAAYSPEVQPCRP